MRKLLPLIVLGSGLLIMSCSYPPSTPPTDSESADTTIVDTTTLTLSKDTITTAIDTPDTTPTEPLRILILPTYNGYVYANHGIDITPYLEQGLQQDSMIEVLSFPYRALQGVSYYGVFHKRYCPPILEKVSADYLIMTALEGGYGLGHPKHSWGYRVRILQAATMEQFNSIEAHKLPGEDDLKGAVTSKISQLISDIKNIQEGKE